MSVSETVLSKNWGCKSGPGNLSQNLQTYIEHVQLLKGLLRSHVHIRRSKEDVTKESPFPTRGFCRVQVRIISPAILAPSSKEHKKRRETSWDLCLGLVQGRWYWGFLFYCFFTCLIFIYYFQQWLKCLYKV